ncbi:metallophosphoesterase family protein [Alkalicoccus urumqiensis]|uniref:Calcineurin-like phosphoesterase domain-containing protein n=1 Tax=Alkalicoccus urumqiensis TaxID=1548213 RepID=A0A2P6MKS6_ALKUR|nr:metallophosphoesterase family protein [Alkalicoccus urumqiensis]PRO66861.1 hypothetical protein C6I21_02755 [Alkalicoccus urumqiensis]
MKLAVISDIHGNRQALEAVLDDISTQRTDAVLCLGDISFRGPDPKGCLELVQKHTDYAVLGNADLWAARGINEGEVPDAALTMMRAEQQFTQALLSEEDLHYLASLPKNLEIPFSNKTQLFAFHATPEDPFPPVLKDAPDDTFRSWTAADSRAEAYVYGHVHTAHHRTLDGKLFLNPGSVGLPFDGDPRASYLLLHKDEHGVHPAFRRVQYDIPRQVKRLEETGYPGAAHPLLTYIYENGALPPQK